MTRSARTPRSSALLCALALLLALHPLSGSALGNGDGLATLLQSLVCGCDTCSPEEAAAPAAESSSCCEEQPAAESGSPDSSPDSSPAGACACGHPANFPPAAPTPLCEAPAGSTYGSAEAFLERHVALSAATLAAFGDQAAPAPGVAGRQSPAVLGDQTGGPPGLADGTPARLAVLCVALI